MAMWSRVRSILGMNTSEAEIELETREAPPANFLFKIESFSLFEKNGIDKYKTTEFVAGDYKWKLIIYLSGNHAERSRCYVSVYLAMVDTDSLPVNCEVNAMFSIFLLNQISGNYVYAPGKTRRFLGIKSKWGFSKFISKKVLMNPSNGYTIDDNCVLGAEVFVLKSSCPSLKNNIVVNNSNGYIFHKPFKHSWNISNFSCLRKIWTSEVFIAQGFRWRIILYPRGYEEESGRYVTIFFQYVCRHVTVKICHTTKIKNQISGEYREQTNNQWFSSDRDTWKSNSFIELATMMNPYKGFIVKDTCVLEVQLFAA